MEPTPALRLANFSALKSSHISVKNTAPQILLLLAVLILSGCTTNQVLPEAYIAGRVLDGITGLPISGASVRFLYRGPTKDLPAARGESQFMEHIEAGVVMTDALGIFRAKIPSRRVKRPLVDPWDTYPDIIVSKEGYGERHILDAQIAPVYHQTEGPPRWTVWPYTDRFEVKLHPTKPKKAPETTSRTATP